MDNSYIYIITALLPIAGAMLVFQVNPYHALVIRGVLGAIAALVYTVLGAPDVALTEALVGTLLAITLYAVAIRSSLVFRLGVVETENHTVNHESFNQLLNYLNEVFRDYHLRVELLTYSDRQELHQALRDKEIHAMCEQEPIPDITTDHSPYQITTRLSRLYDILNGKPLESITRVHYIDPLTIAEVKS
jgi:putative multicomponent Na+:H+ antiporter subunit B